MTKTYDYDLFVIGAGSGGVRASRIAAAHGAKVATGLQRHRFLGESTQPMSQLTFEPVSVVQQRIRFPRNDERRSRWPRRVNVTDARTIRSCR